MRALILTTLDGLIGNKPRVTSTAFVPPPCMAPAPDVALIRIGNSDRESIYRGIPILGQVEDELVAIRNEPVGVDRFEVSTGDKFALPGLHGDGLNPADRILQHKDVLEHEEDFVWEH